MNLTAEQRAVVEAPLDERQLVLAGPGTGKTHTLVARLVHLVEAHALSPGQDVLVLSFTRNAVREIRRRVRSAGGDVAYVTALTFDSFATRMLAQINPNGGWTAQGFDGRIRSFAQSLSEPDAELREMLKDVRHVFVDEVQDLVCDRAQLVMALLGATTAGFTLLGDPAQAIYGYQARDAGSALEPIAEWAKSRYPELSIRSLSENHRIKTAAAGVALGVAARLQRRRPTASTRAALADAYRRIPELTNLATLQAVAREGTVAVLCRNNGQALVISQELHAEGIDHQLQGDTAYAPTEAWLSRLLMDVGTAQLTRRDFDDLVAEAGIVIDEDDAWRSLRKMGRAGKAVDLPLVAARLGARWVPDELAQAPQSHVLVSSIHRAKGLEFDKTILVADGLIDPQDEDPDVLAEEARVLFVAMTRAATAMSRYELPKQWGLRQDKRSERWILGGTGKHAWHRRGIQLMARDIDAQAPATSRSGSDARTIQDYLWHDVRRGQEVVLEADPTTTTHDGVVYEVKISDRVVGRTSASFTGALRRELGPQAERWPYRIAGARVSAVSSVAGTRASAERHGFDGFGFWLALQLEGLARFDWSRRVGDTEPSPTPVAVADAQPHRRATQTENREMWRHLKKLAAAGDETGIRRDLPDKWAHKLAELLGEARRHHG